MLRITRADLNLSTHAQAFIDLLNTYAHDPMGGGDGLSDFARDNLVNQLKQRAGVIIVLAFEDDEPVGLVNCFEGFSTFQCKPILNIHDVIVAPAFRGRDISTHLLTEVEAIARQMHCCKLTLEVLEHNEVAKAAYRKAGFSGYQLDPAYGQALFWEKKL